MLPPPELDCSAPPESEPLAFTPEFDPLVPGLIQRMERPPGKVAVLRASRIGDFINAIPALHALRTHLPQAHLTVITLPLLSDLARRCPVIDRVVAFPGYPGLADQFFAAPRTLRFFEEMQAEQFDLAIQMQGTGVYSNPFMLMLAARYTAGFIRPGDPPGRLAAALPWPETGHETQRVLALTRFLGIPDPDDLIPGIHLLPQDHHEALRWLAQTAPPWIGLHIAARDQTRRWPIERFAQAAAQLQRQYGGSLILLGETRDRASGQAALAAADVPFLNLAGCTSLPVSAAILQRLSIFLTNDSGPAHLAYAMQAPTVTIFGGGDPARNGPLRQGPFRVLAHPIACRPCESPDCPIGLQCLEHISVDQVVKSAQSIFRPVQVPPGL